MRVERLREEMLRWLGNEPIGSIVLHNGRYTLVLNGYTNRRRSEASSIKRLLERVVELLPGSYGLLYEHDEGVVLPTGRGLFTVTTIKMGQIFANLDPFLSPTIPVIESLE